MTLAVEPESPDRPSGPKPDTANMSYSPGVVDTPMQAKARCADHPWSQRFMILTKAGGSSHPRRRRGQSLDSWKGKGGGYRGAPLWLRTGLWTRGNYTGASRHAHAAARMQARDQVLCRFGAEHPSVLLAVNVDGVGYSNGGAAYSCYGCSEHVQGRIRKTFAAFEGISQGDPWFSGDHMLFVQGGAPALAITSEKASELMHTVIHASRDAPNLVEAGKLVEIASALTELIRAM